VISKLVAVLLSEQCNAINSLLKYTLVLNTPVITFTDLGGLDPTKRRNTFLKCVARSNVCETRRILHDNSWTRHFSYLYFFEGQRTERLDSHYALEKKLVAHPPAHHIAWKIWCRHCSCCSLSCRSYADTLQMVADGRGIVSVVFCASSIKNGLNLMGVQRIGEVKISAAGNRENYKGGFPTPAPSKLFRSFQTLYETLAHLSHNAVL